jgi:hypothetical protein
MTGPPAWLEPSRLELLADDAGVGPGDLREWLRGEVAQRAPRHRRGARRTRRSYLNRALAAA